MNIVSFINLANDLGVWVIVVILLVASWKVSGWRNSIEGRLDNLEDKFDRLDHRVDKLEYRVTDLEKVVHVISETLKLHLTGNPMSKTGSPLRLTKHGRSVASEVNADEIASSVVDKMKASTKEMNAYETQQHCFQYSEYELLDELKETNRPFYERITSCAYQNGIDTIKVMHVIGIVLRDQVLEQLGKVPLQVNEGKPKSEYP